MSYQLSIDTATGINVGLAKDHQPVAAKTEHDTRSHAELTQSLINQLYESQGITAADLDEVIVGLGPGPFTGLRVGIVTGAVIAELVGAKLRGICTLDAIALSWVAANGNAPDEFIVVTDARRKEVYWAKYDAAGNRIGEPQVNRPTEVDNLAAIGAGTEVYPEIFADRLLSDPLHGLDADVVAARAAELPDMGRDPIYLRSPDVTMPTTRKSSLSARRIQL